MKRAFKLLSSYAIELEFLRWVTADTPTNHGILIAYTEKPAHM